MNSFRASNQGIKSGHQIKPINQPIKMSAPIIVRRCGACRQVGHNRQRCLTVTYVAPPVDVAWRAMTDAVLAARDARVERERQATLAVEAELDLEIERERQATLAGRTRARAEAGETDPYAHIPIDIFIEIDAFRASGDEENAHRLAGEHGILLASRDEIQAMRENQAAREELSREPPTPEQNLQRAAELAAVRDQVPLSVIPPSTPPTPLSSATTECVACMEFAKTTVLMPCRHLCLCSKCGEQVTKCPICRTQIAERINVFI